MRERLKQLVDQINESADQLMQSNNLMSETLHGIADELEAAIQPQWVPVGERLPDGFGDVWLMINGEAYLGCHAGNDVWVIADGRVVQNVTHWHEIEYPEPPEVKTNE